MRRARKRPAKQRVVTSRKFVASPSYGELMGKPVTVAVNLPESMPSDAWGKGLARAARALRAAGFRKVRPGLCTLTAEIAPKMFEKLFKTRLKMVGAIVGNDICAHKTGTICKVQKVRKVLYPKPGGAWRKPENLEAVTGNIQVQWPAMTLALVPAMPPPLLAGSGRIFLPDMLRTKLGCDGVDVLNATGAGVRVAMIDTGFDVSHPYFDSCRSRMTIVAAPGASSGRRDTDGHGTAMCANLFAVAPDIEFVGVGLDCGPDTLSPAALLNGLIEAEKHKPDIVVLSIAFDLADPNASSRRQARFLFGSLTGLRDEIQAMASRGVRFICAAGNGQFAFPAMMPEVIAVGGAAFTDTGDTTVSDISSAFVSRIYQERKVPDVCGLSGLSTARACLLLPCPAGSTLDRQCSVTIVDGTAVDDGWCYTYGTSAAAPQVAGLSALLLEKSPGLATDALRTLLQDGALDITIGCANIETGGLAAARGRDIASGAGLINGKRSFDLLP